MVVKELGLVGALTIITTQRDIIANVRRLLNGDAMEPMDPWYKWFKGTIENAKIPSLRMLI